MPRLSKIGAACLSAFGFGTGGANAVTADYLVVAGGGGGTTTGVSGTGGGGGAGGLLSSTLSLSLTTSYTIIVGAGGTLGAQGSNSSINSLVTAVGGGYGGANNSGNGGNGGSGGGGGNYTADSSGGTGTAGQGNNGGGGHGAAGSYSAAGGGGGAGAAGTTPTTSAGGAGGIGVSSSITGTATYYAGGGGGASDNSTGGAGGNGGGGKGASVSSVAGVSGTANLGGGGGGALNATAGGSGGSGVVIIRYLGAQQFGGGIVSSDGTYTIHTFKTSGQLVPMTPITASYLIVAGGGGGGGAGGGGGGGFLTGSTLAIDTSSTYVITVGAGGAGAGPFTSGAADAFGVSGTASSISLYSTSAVGGGGGGSYSNTSANANGLSGGSGGGGGWANIGTVLGGSGTAGQGYAGGSGDTTTAPYNSGGGGGAGAIGGSASGAVSGNGGAGLSTSILGSTLYFSGGGGGGSQGSGSTPGNGGIGGGGGGANGYGGTNVGSGGGSALVTGGAGTTGGAGAGGVGGSGGANTGGGGGGMSISAITGGNGGSGIVVISYAGTTQLMAGGTVTIVGGNVIHTFTSSGYLTPLTFVGRSLRFRGSASAYLSRTPANGGDRQKWTWSGWVKRGTLGTRQGWFSAGPTSGRGDTNTLQFGWQDTNGFQMGVETQYVLQSSQVFRDPAAWYHCVVAFDSTQASASNRVRLYVTGQEVTAWSTDNRSTYVTLNSSLGINLSGNPTYIGTITPSLSFSDGYMAEVRFIDGQALTPNSFGTFNSYGVWQPINYGGSYGTNGFYLPFSDTTSTTTLCYDQGPQGNHWTPNNISLTAGSTYDSMTDVPTLTSSTAANYCVLNPLSNLGTGTISDGNLRYSNSSGSWKSAASTLFPSSGKWYFESTIVQFSTGIMAGIANTNFNSWSTYMGSSANAWALQRTGTDTIVWNNNSSTTLTAGASTTVGDVFMVAYDIDAAKIWFGRNGTWYSSGDPAAGTNPIYSNLTGSLGPAVSTSLSGDSVAINCGQRPFAYTPPSGFVALNTYNL